MEQIRSKTRHSELNQSQAGRGGVCKGDPDLSGICLRQRLLRRHSPWRDRTGKLQALKSRRRFWLPDWKLRWRVPNQQNSIHWQSSHSHLAIIYELFKSRIAAAARNACHQTGAARSSLRCQISSFSSSGALSWNKRDRGSHQEHLRQRGSLRP